MCGIPAGSGFIAGGLFMQKKKPKWGKPKLIILTRGKPEERVLEICRGGRGTRST
jgi:hypothetical protein